MARDGEIKKDTKGLVPVGATDSPTLMEDTEGLVLVGVTESLVTGDVIRERIITFTGAGAGAGVERSLAGNAEDPAGKGNRITGCDLWWLSNRFRFFEVQNNFVL